MQSSFSQPQIETTAILLGLPVNEPFINRRIAKAFDLVESHKVSQIDDGLFRVQSQYEPDKSYIISTNHGAPECSCPDGKRTVWCKHQIAARLFTQNQQSASKLIIYINPFNNERNQWAVDEDNKTYIVKNENGKWRCTCGKPNCKHCKAIREHLPKRTVNECGSVEAKALQDKLNGDNGSNNNGNGDESSPSHPQLDATNPFEASELLDIAQIEGRGNGELVHKLSNGEYVVSYRGVMALAEHHGIELSVREDTNTVIAYARRNGSSRLSGKPVNGSAFTAGELAKRNAARQLLPYPEIKALEKKCKLASEFDWKEAKAKCLEIVPDFKVGIMIHDLVQSKLRQAHPSDYDRIEWLMIYDACKKDAETNNDDNNDGGDDSPSSPEWETKLRECQDAARNYRRYYILKTDLRREGIIPKEHPKEWDDGDFGKLKEECEVDASLFSRDIGYWRIELEPNKGIWSTLNRYQFLLTPLQDRCFWCEETKDNLQDCCVEWGRYTFKTLLCLDCQPSTEELTSKFDKLYRGVADPSERSAELPETEEAFIAECKKAEAIGTATDDNSVEANAMPVENSDGKRKLVMDKDKNITLIEADGIEKSMRMKDVAFTFGSDVVMRLTQGIQLCGADVSTVEFDD